MRNAAILAVLLAGCTQQQLSTAASTPAGALFCSFQMAGGGSMIAAMIDAAASATSAGPVAVIATGATKAFVDNTCATAALTITGASSGVPVSPPAQPATAPQVAVVVPQAK